MELLLIRMCSVGGPAVVAMQRSDCQASGALALAMESALCYDSAMASPNVSSTARKLAEYFGF